MSEPLTLSGKILAAHPLLRDPNFRRTVIYLIHHSKDEGSLGVVLNRPSGHVVSDLVKDSLPERVADIPVFIGGPVGMDRLGFLHFQIEGNTMQGLKNISLDTVDDALLLGHGHLIGMVGHSGWAAGQLEAELRSLSWIMTRPRAEHFAFGDTPSGEKLWLDVMDATGPRFSLLAREPDDVSGN